ncbi:MAG: RNA polymerase subunit sigma-24 [Planctomycetes bacterium]|nr:RNA polymerase subunit sigma-24 [Planctomycetota bacterium]
MTGTPTIPMPSDVPERDGWLIRLHADLKHLARGCFRPGWRRHTLQSTALVHEALIRMFQHERAGGEASGLPRERVLALAAKVMRHVLIDHARRRQTRQAACAANCVLATSAKREESFPAAADMLVFDEMLERLAHVDARAARVIELRFFGGFTVGETASLLGLSMSTAEADSRFALAWMRRDMTSSE